MRMNTMFSIPAQTSNNNSIGNANEARKRTKLHLDASKIHPFGTNKRWLQKYIIFRSLISFEMSFFLRCVPLSETNQA